MSASSVRWRFEAAKVERAARSSIRAGLRDGIEIAEKDAARRTPRRSGRLAESATVSVEDTQASVTWDTPYAALRDRSDYAQLQSGERLFAENALYGNARQIRDAVLRQLKNGF